jgi:hypothetical protein
VLSQRPATWGDGVSYDELKKFYALMLGKLDAKASLNSTA